MLSLNSKVGCENLPYCHDSCASKMQLGSDGLIMLLSREVHLKTRGATSVMIS